MKFSKSILCLLLALSLFAGCAGAFAEESGFPLVNEPITFTAFTPWVEHMSDPATNTMNVTYEEMTGVHIDWIQSQDYITDLNLMIAGEQDVDLWLIPFSTSQVLTMVDAGKLLPLNDLIDEYAPNLKAALEEHPEFREYLTAPDGNIYTFFTTDCGLHMPNRRKMFVKKDWLNAYRESVGDETAPNTVEEFEEMLVFFRDSDLNGNGAQDEIPLIGSTNGEDDPLYFLMNAFTQASNSFYHIEDGQIVFEANSDAWREGLKWMAHLNSEGLLYGEETYVQDRDQLRALVNVSDPANYAVAAIPTFWEGRFVDSSVLNWTDYEAILPLEDADGVRRAVANGTTSFTMQCAISSTCSDPVTAIRWLDWWVGEEGSFAQHWGMVEGEDYEYRDVPAINGAEPSVAALKDSYTSNFRFGENVTPKLDRESIRYAASLDETVFNTNNSYVLYVAGKAYQPYWVDTNIPLVTWSADTDLINSMNEYATLINDTVRMAYTEFILGLRDINNDSDWQAYLDELDAVGLDAYLELLTQYYAL